MNKKQVNISEFKINQELQQHILSYTANMDDEEYLFKLLRSPFPIKRVQDTKPCSKENRHLRNRYPHSSENMGTADCIALTGVIQKKICKLFAD
jgi:hypothetical protein